MSRRYRGGREAEVAALSDVTLDIHAGEFVAVMGPSGSGKTTLMNIIGCLDRPSDGKYLFAGQPVHSADADQRARLRRDAFGFVFQNYNLLRMATAQENVEMPAVYAGMGKRGRWKRAKELLSMLGLSHRFGHQPNQLSGGEQQRVAIARALMNGGEVLLADEPTGSLDSRSGKEIMAQLTALSERGHTVILVTHDDSVAHYAQRRIELLDGRVVADSGADTVNRAPAAKAYAGAERPSNTIRVPTVSLGESARTAIRALRANRFRTALTLLGIVIGVFSVTAMLGVAGGMRSQILDSFRQLGGTGITITPGFGEDRAPLNLSDADAIRTQVPNLESVAPEMNGGALVVAGGNSEPARVTATTGLAMQSQGLELAQGAFFADSHSQRYAPVVVLGGLLAGKLFGEQANAVGEYVLMNGAPYQVVGILKRGEGRFAAFDFRGQAVYVPLLTGARRLFGRENLDSIQVLVSATEEVGTAQQAIEALLRQRHGGAPFQIVNQEQFIEAQNTVGRIISVVFGAIGGVSLVVAGIGVMNIMLASVAERTREIGLRMATGARPRDIWLQFVCEAVAVCGLGGLAGLALAAGLGSVANNVAANFETAVVAFSPWILMVGFSFATLTGLVFGAAPARRAASMDPVAALAS
ncbi:ABC transporter permease [Candidatus Foliamicus sp.]